MTAAQFEAQLGYYRDACRNMAMIRTVDGRCAYRQYPPYVAPARQAGRIAGDVRYAGRRLG